MALPELCNEGGGRLIVNLILTILQFLLRLLLNAHISIELKSKTQLRGLYTEKNIIYHSLNNNIY